jgi:hypothetical protein
LTIAGAALSIGSTVANAAGARKAAKARDSALAAERIRQGGLDREAQALNATSQDRYTDAGAKTEEKAKSLGDFFTAEAPDEGANAGAASVMPTATNDIVTQEIAKKSGQAKQFTDQQGNALATMRAFGDVLGDTGRLQARDASEIGQIGGFKRGSSEVLPLELDAAAQKGAGLRLLGDILGGVGGVALNAGLTRGPKVAGAAKPTYGKPLFGGDSFGPTAWGPNAPTNVYGAY